MRQTDIKTIYLSSSELRLAIAGFVSRTNPELADTMTTYDSQIGLTEDGMVIRISEEIEAFNTTPEFVTNAEE
jgi:hypothetical protein|tara:strand:- start:955 stop:1173 length:219 start_codon:yes stop_codon:yes gene_type:complete